MPQQPPLLGQADLGAVGELARLAEVVDERRGEQQVGVQARMQLAGLKRERRYRDRVLEQAAEVGVMAGPGAGRPAPVRAQRRVAEQVVQQRAVPGLVHLARQVLEEAVELVEVAVGDREERRRVGLGCVGRARSSAPRPGARRGSARRAARPRDEVAAVEAAGQRVGVAERARRDGARCGRAARAPGRASRCAPSGGPCASRRRPRSTSWPGRRVAIARRVRHGGRHPARCPRRSPAHHPCMYRDSDAAADLGTPPRRPARPGAGVRVQGLERRRRRGLGGALVRRLAARRRRASRRSIPRSSSTSRPRARGSGSSRAARARSTGPRSRSTRRACPARRAT